MLKTSQMKFAIVTFFLLGSFSIAADDADSRKLLKDLQGSYKLIAFEQFGEPAPIGYVDSFEKISIKGNELFLASKGDDGKLKSVRLTITVDATSKPAHFNFKSDDGLNEMGIVVIQGQMVKICHCQLVDQKRPTEFKTSKDLKYGLMTLKKTEG